MKKVFLGIMSMLLALALIMPVSALEGSNASGDAEETKTVPTDLVVSETAEGDIKISTEDLDYLSTLVTKSESYNHDDNYIFLVNFDNKAISFYNQYGHFPAACSVRLSEVL